MPYKTYTITDLHLTGCGLLRKEIMGEIRWLVQNYAPDLVVNTGDITSCTAKVTQQVHVDVCEYVTQTLGVPYLVTFGNHADDLWFMSDEEIEEAYPEGYRHTLIQDIVDRCGGKGSLFMGYVGEAESSEGHSADNVVPIYSSESASDPAGLIWVLDTHSGGLEESQVEWVRDTVSAEYTDNETGEIPPSLVYWHISTAEWDPSTEHVTGVYGDTIRDEVSARQRYPGVLSDVLDAIGNAWLVSVGHDHLNNHALETSAAVQPSTADRPVTLMYGMKTCISAYGMLDMDAYTGGRVFNLSIDEGDLSVETFLARLAPRDNRNISSEDYRIALYPGMPFVEMEQTTTGVYRRAISYMPMLVLLPFSCLFCCLMCCVCRRAYPRRKGSSLL
ncbi:hypothetical protein KIPB_002207 [Kipferlia bialata]|uniref:Calcineurin-like phosphoesterase domain-containing protein n=1 Tax=Kipferlia bialata TaxID=797122 RepID=A0A9K3CPU5_9EUKA|nr:hypothetical protein KIPB_002207 [Kipferlia bialata]|eukprot:g2207.t1